MGPIITSLIVIPSLSSCKGDVKLRGIYRLRINSRKVIFVKGGRLDLRAPRLSQPFLTLQPGADGDDGKDGIAGPLGRR